MTTDLVNACGFRFVSMPMVVKDDSQTGRVPDATHANKSFKVQTAMN